MKISLHMSHLSFAYSPLQLILLYIVKFPPFNSVYSKNPSWVKKILALKMISQSSYFSFIHGSNFIVHGFFPFLCKRWVNGFVVIFWHWDLVRLVSGTIGSSYSVLVGHGKTNVLAAYALKTKKVRGITKYF